MEIINVLLAKFFDKLKVTNPFIFGIVAIILAVALPGINTAIETGLLSDSPVLAKIVTIITYLIPVVLGVRTTKIIEESKKED